MGADNRYISRLRIRVTLWNILLDSHMQHFLLRVGRGPGIFANVLRLEGVFLYMKRRRHLASMQHSTSKGHQLHNERLVLQAGKSMQNDLTQDSAKDIMSFP